MRCGMQSDIDSIIGPFLFLVLCTAATSGLYPNLSYGRFASSLLELCTSITLLGRLSFPRASDRYMLCLSAITLVSQHNVPSSHHLIQTCACHRRVILLLRSCSTVFDSASSPLTMSKPSTRVISTTHLFLFQHFQSDRTSAHARQPSLADCRGRGVPCHDAYLREYYRLPEHLTGVPCLGMGRVHRHKNCRHFKQFNDSWNC